MVVSSPKLNASYSSKADQYHYERSIFAPFSRDASGLLTIKFLLATSFAII
jgi:hypothetical protein